MAAHNIPYVQGYGNISKVLEKIQTAQTPPRFTQDFLGGTLDIRGGSAKPVIPFLKRIGFLASDGTPTDRYKRFRNSTYAGAAAAEALKDGFAPLYEINEQAHTLSDSDLKGIVMQATGLGETSDSVDRIVGSFKSLRKFADFTAVPSNTLPDKAEAIIEPDMPKEESLFPKGINLGYTINIHLPATSDINVYNAIFKSLRENILD
jgi:hypothetical protein